MRDDIKEAGLLRLPERLLHKSDQNKILTVDAGRLSVVYGLIAIGNNPQHPWRKGTDEKPGLNMRPYEILNALIENAQMNVMGIARKQFSTLASAFVVKPVDPQEQSK